MAIAILFILLLLGLTAVFAKAAEWFQENKKNITPAALIDVIAEIIFILHYGSKETRDIVWMCVAIVIVIVIIAFNLFKYGLKDGVFASLVELVFSISAAFLILCAIVASGQNGKKKRKK